MIKRLSQFNQIVMLLAILFLVPLLFNGDHIVHYVMGDSLHGGEGYLLVLYFSFCLFYFSIKILNLKDTFFSTLVYSSYFIYFIFGLFGWVIFKMNVCMCESCQPTFMNKVYHSILYASEQFIYVYAVLSLIVIYLFIQSIIKDKVMDRFILLMMFVINLNFIFYTMATGNHAFTLFTTVIILLNVYATIIMYLALTYVGFDTVFNDHKKINVMYEHYKLITQPFSFLVIFIFSFFLLLVSLL